MGAMAPHFGGLTALVTSPHYLLLAGATVAGAGFAWIIDQMEDLMEDENREARRNFQLAGDARMNSTDPNELGLAVKLHAESLRQGGPASRPEQAAIAQQVVADLAERGVDLNTPEARAVVAEETAIIALAEGEDPQVVLRQFVVDRMNSPLTSMGERVREAFENMSPDEQREVLIGQITRQAAESGFGLSSDMTPEQFSRIIEETVDSILATSDVLSPSGQGFNWTDLSDLLEQLKNSAIQNYSIVEPIDGLSPSGQGFNWTDLLEQLKNSARGLPYILAQHPALLEQRNQELILELFRQMGMRIAPGTEDRVREILPAIIQDGISNPEIFSEVDENLLSALGIRAPSERTIVEMETYRSSTGSDILSSSSGSDRPIIVAPTVNNNNTNVRQDGAGDRSGGIGPTRDFHFESNGS